MNNENLEDNDSVLILEDDVFFTNDDLREAFKNIKESTKSLEIDILYISGRFEKYFQDKNINIFERKLQIYLRELKIKVMQDMTGIEQLYLILITKKELLIYTNIYQII